MREAIKAFKALADENRLRVLNLIIERECCVCEVMQALEISQSNASRHLGALYDAGFLKLRKVGLWSLYSIEDENEAAYILDLIGAAKKALANNKKAREDIKRLKNANRSSPNLTQNNT